ncbi:hypothetical protein [Streptomyces sp. NPDC059455]|uniref:hypothetical protein n=1 Tax=Streptomyces sp. NPDC059455 TaxID=3346837 RepID=UPI0036930D74
MRRRSFGHRFGHGVGHRFGHRFGHGDHGSDPDYGDHGVGHRAGHRFGDRFGDRFGHRAGHWRGHSLGHAAPDRSRHPFEPGKLVAGLVILGLAAAYGMDAAGKWDVRPEIALPALLCGLCVAALTSALTYAFRRRSSRATPDD